MNRNMGNMGGRGGQMGAQKKWVAPEVPHLGAHLAHGSNNPKETKPPVATGEIPGVNKEVAKDNNNKVGVASNSNAKHLLTIMVAVMALAAAVVATGTTKDNNKEEVTLAVRIGADFVKISFINS